MYLLSVFKDQSFSYQGYATAGIACPDELFVRLLLDASTYGDKGKVVYCSISNRWSDKMKKDPTRPKQKSTKNSPIFHPLDNYIWLTINHIGGVIISVVASSVGDREFESRSDQTKHYKIGTCCFSSKHH